MNRIKRVRYKHPLAIRWFHWINFPILFIMVWSGLLIYWANDIYRLGWGNQTVLKFFPKSFNEALNIPFRLAEGMSLHFFFMWLFALNGLCYVLALWISGQWKWILPNKRSIKESFWVVLHSLRLRKKLPEQVKYNAAQRMAYTTVIVLGILMLLNGLAIYKPVQLNWLCALFGGYETARMIHFIITILFVLFFLVHVIQVILHGWNNFRAMLTGYEVINEPLPPQQTDYADIPSTEP